MLFSVYFRPQSGFLGLYFKVASPAFKLLWSHPTCYPRHTLQLSPLKKKALFFFFTPNFHRSDLKDVLLNKCLKPFSSALRIWRFPPAPSHWCRSLCCQEHDSLIRLNSRCLLLFKLCLLHWSPPSFAPSLSSSSFPPIPLAATIHFPPPFPLHHEKKEKKLG